VKQLPQFHYIATEKWDFYSKYSNTKPEVCSLYKLMPSRLSYLLAKGWGGQRDILDWDWHTSCFR